MNIKSKRSIWGLICGPVPNGELVLHLRMAAVWIVLEASVYEGFDVG